MKVILHTCVQTSWPPKGHYVESKPKSSRASFGEPYGSAWVEAQDEHHISTPNGWTNQKGELGYPTIPKELCGGRSTRLVDHLEFYYNNSKHSAIKSTPFQMVTGKSPIVPTTWAALGQPPSDASEEMSMVMQLDEERRRLWEMAKANLEKTHKWYKDFANKSRRKVNFEEGDEVWLNIKNL